MTAVVLIHGGAHGAWCWEPVIGGLRAAGHEVRAIDLPGRDGTATGGSTVTFEDWVACVAAAVDASAQPPVLIAHSMGGLSSSQLAERRPGDIAGIVYVSAVVPVDGGAGLPTLQQAGPACALLAEGALIPSADGTTITVVPDHARIAFYADCPEPDVQQALGRLCSEAVLPMVTPLQLGANFAAVPKHYIGASRDKAVPPDFQRTMAQQCGASYEPIEADHSPFYSAPQPFLAMLLDRIAAG
jgi:pimeloyl-ACP methyl ester carboxylesterase